MIELLQDLQVALGSFVVPLVIAMSGLLFFIIIIYAIGVIFHWKRRRTGENIKRNWRRFVKKENTGSDHEEFPLVQVAPFDHRDDIIQVLRSEEVPRDKVVDIYQEKGLYDKDKNDLSRRAWWKRVQALHRLRHISLDDLQGEVTTFLYDTSHEVRLIALDSLSSLDELPELDSVRLFESFAEKLDSFLVIKLLALKPDKSFVRPLIGSEKPRLRRAGATILGQPSETELLPFLSKIAKDKDGEVRRRAAESLGRIGEYGALSILKETSKDTKPGVRESSARSLGGIFHEDSIEILDKLAADDDFRVRLAAFSSLARFGEEGREAIGNHWSDERRLAREAIFESYQE